MTSTPSDSHDQPENPENSAPSDIPAPETTAATEHVATEQPAPEAASSSHEPAQPAAHPAPEAADPAPEPAYAAPTVPQYVAGESAPAPAASAEPKKRSVAVPVVAALAVGAVLGGASGAGVTAWVGSMQPKQTSSTPSTPQTITVNNPDDVNATTAVAAKAGPSVVTISVTSQSGAGTGSGVILSDDGYVLTNTHVVTLDGASGDGTVQVTTYDGRIYTAAVVGTDPTVDLAVIKLDDASDLQPIDFADSDDLNVGDTAIAIGAPLGLSNTVTDGIVSALNRSIQIASSAAPDNADENQSDGGQDGSDSPFDFWQFDQGQGQQTQSTGTISIPVIQTDAAINPGNSGGALVNDQGELIGINVAIASAGSGGSSSQSGNIGVGFSIPANLAKRVSDEIIASGAATHGLLGANVRDATAEDGDTVGALIAEVSSGGAAASAGLRQGDVVTEFDGHPITGSTDLTAQVRTLAGGADATITYMRDGESTTVDVTLGTFSD